MNSLVISFIARHGSLLLLISVIYTDIPSNTSGYQVVAMDLRDFFPERHLVCFHFSSLRLFNLD